jgi:hypothetical protein
MKRAKVEISYNSSKPEVVGVYLQYFETNLQGFLEQANMQIKFDIKESKENSINMQFKNLENGKIIVLETFGEIKDYFGDIQINNGGFGSDARTRQIRGGGSGSGNTDNPDQHFMNYMNDIGATKLGSEEDEEDNRSGKRKIDPTLALQSHTQKTNEFKKQYESKRGVNTNKTPPQQQHTRQQIPIHADKGSMNRARATGASKPRGILSDEELTMHNLSNQGYNG